MSALPASVLTADSFGRAVRLLLPALRGFAHRLTRDRTQSEDLVQETLLRAWAARHRFIPDTNLKAWLFRIEYNCFLTFLRKNRRAVQLNPDMAEIRLTAPATQEDGLMMRDLASAIAALPRHQAAALILINEEEMRYDDAAERLGIPLGTLKSRVTRGRAAILKAVTGDLTRSAIPRAEGGEPHLKPASDALRPVSNGSRYAAWKGSGQSLIG